MGVIDVLGLISGAMGLWSFVEDMFPAQEADHSTFKVFVGLDQTANPSDPGDCCLTGAGGSIHYSKLFNDRGELIGYGGEEKLSSGSAQTISMWQKVPQQAVTTELISNKDAICIAAIGATLIDGTRWGWVGDWGKICGINWYYSGVKQPQWDNDTPLCTWIDADHSEGITAAVIAINWPGFTTNVLPTDGGVGKCGNNFGAWESDGGSSVIINSTANDDGNRDVLNRPRARDHRLVVSSVPAHSADDLCQHPMSRGPDFVSLAERTHCNMHTREVLPLCADGVTTGCFDLEAETAGRDSSLARVDAPVVGASRVIYW
ncbi:hypothetical protein Daus18300_000640 [Diaporthe australafricana]|uniref:Uncharacterized protein n=1 Tax=Diaporthe australafricana TaxID=127596 RepID=A0ABR3Y2H6_9PEZI